MPKAEAPVQDSSMISTSNIISSFRRTRNQSRAPSKSPKSTSKNEKRRRRHDPWAPRRRKSQQRQILPQMTQVGQGAYATKTDPDSEGNSEKQSHRDVELTLDKPANGTADVTNTKSSDHGTTLETSGTIATLTADDEEIIEDRRTLMNLIDLRIQILNKEIEDLKTNNGDSDSSHDSLFDSSNENNDPEDATPGNITPPRPNATLHERLLASTPDELPQRRVLHRREQQWPRYMSPPDSPPPADYVDPSLRAIELHPALTVVPPSPEEGGFTNSPAFIDYRSESSMFHKTLAPWRKGEGIKRG